jgi:hypothetical protein
MKTSAAWQEDSAAVFVVAERVGASDQGVEVIRE